MGRDKVPIRLTSFFFFFKFAIVYVFNWIVTNALSIYFLLHS